MKKISSLILCILLTLSLFNFSAFAQVNVGGETTAASSSIGILSTNVWAEKSVIEMGEMSIFIIVSLTSPMLLILKFIGMGFMKETFIFIRKGIAEVINFSLTRKACIDLLLNLRICLNTVVQRP